MLVRFYFFWILNICFLENLTLSVLMYLIISFATFPSQIYITISTFTSARPCDASHFRVLSRSELQKTPAEQSKAKLCKIILKLHGESSRGPVRQLLSKAKLSYVVSILKPHGQIFINPNRLLLPTAFHYLSMWF